MCVLLVTKNILLGDVLENLLANLFHPRSYPVLRLNSSDLSERIHHYQPDVIILEEGLVAELSLWSRQQLHTGRIPIILIHPQKNQVQLGDQCPIILTQIADFTALFNNITAAPSL